MLPDGIGGLDCGDLCDMGHHGNICQVHDMFETSGMVSSYYLCNKNILSTHGSWFSAAFHSSCRRMCCSSMVSQLILLFEALSRVTVRSCAIRRSALLTILSNGQKKNYL